jgi:hypothetical protein
MLVTHMHCHPRRAVAEHSGAGWGHATWWFALVNSEFRLKTSAGLRVNSTAAVELGLHGYMLFDDGLNNETLTRLGITDDEQYARYVEAVNKLDERITKSPRRCVCGGGGGLCVCVCP